MKQIMDKTNFYFLCFFLPVCQKAVGAQLNKFGFRGIFHASSHIHYQRHGVPEQREVFSSKEGVILYMP